MNVLMQFYLGLSLASSLFVTALKSSPIIIIALQTNTVIIHETLISINYRIKRTSVPYTPYSSLIGPSLNYGRSFKHSSLLQHLRMDHFVQFHATRLSVVQLTFATQDHLLEPGIKCEKGYSKHLQLDWQVRVLCKYLI